jgi:hypothetical protein
MNSPTASSPHGQHAYFFASRLGWPIQPGMNVVLEGEHDERYFRLANYHYRLKKGLMLLGDGFEVFAAGRGALGGTDGIRTNFHTIFKNAQIDLGPDNRPVYRLATLLDDDIAGGSAANSLTAQYTDCALWRDVFLLKRCYPSDTRDLKQVERQIKELNKKWHGHHCEIEDLLPKPLVDLFHWEKPNCYYREPKEVAGRWHFEFADGVKGALCTFVEENAMAEDLQDIVEVIKTRRFFLRIDPKDGSPLP